LAGFEVSTDGRFSGVHRGLDKNAILAVSSWEFRPAVKDGQPVAVYATINVTFHMISRWRTVGVEFRVPPGASRPAIHKAGAPRIAGEAGASAAVALEVDQHGDPVNVRAEKASDENWGREVVAAVEKWKFSPGMKDGNPISVPVKMTFVRQE
jgi:TonB family protein